MVNIKNVTISKDGDFNKLSFMYDLVDDEGKIIGTNNRITRIITDETILAHMDAIKDYGLTVIE